MRPKKRVKRVASSVSSIQRTSSAFTLQRGGPTLNGFPIKKNATLRYVQEITLVGALTPVYYVFRLNSIYDPDYNSIIVGHQPMGHDQWKGIYKDYRVNRAVIRVLPITDAASHVTPGLTTLGVADRATPLPTVATDLYENPLYTAPRIIGPLGHDAWQRPMIQEVDCAKFLGMRDLADNDEVVATFGSNPTSQVYGILALSPVNDNTPGTHKFLVTIEYDCTFTAPVRLAQS